MNQARGSLALVAITAGLCLAQQRPPVRKEPRPKPDPVVLASSDVAAVVEAAASSVNSDAMVIAVTDRQGDILAVYQKPSAPAMSAANFGAQADTREVAVALARTASFFSNDQAPLSSRTVRYISGIHFPPGIDYTSQRAAVRDREHESRVFISRRLPYRTGFSAGAHPSMACSPGWAFSREKRI